MKLDTNALDLFLYAAQNKTIYFRKEINSQLYDEEAYILKSHDIKEFTKDSILYSNLIIDVQNSNKDIERIVINNIKNMDYSIGENSVNEFRIWIFPINIGKPKIHSQAYQEEDTNIKASYRLRIYPDLYFLDNSGRSGGIELIQFMRINPIFIDRDFKRDYDKVFIAMPFKEEKYTEIYRNHIKTQLDKMYLKAVRVDDEHYSGDVMEFVWREINESAFVIAEISTTNPNVLYEIGVAHTLGKHVIILTDGTEEVPFDLKKNRYIEYNMDNLEKLESEISLVVENIVKEINYATINDRQILSGKELKELGSKLKLFETVIIQKQFNLALIMKQENDLIKEFRETESLGQSVYLDNNKLIVDLSLYNEKNLAFTIDLSNSEYIKILNDIVEGKAVCEIYVINDNLSDMSIKRILDSDMTKLQLSRQLRMIE
ncbi:hypothetical protein Ccar_03560 [Clostridium carboxidivorans P7]|uniref:Uncharacterized protein n=1 Tax=Clostridium carboxidivorans P7 TaxID=536227 RepID=C6PP58_9CLOT|nr:hypothetical protein [Clostridium carboxidivorans]AKN29958.1 hypothetical protein Ccar_03560 [Clostridium carboxidivorans P7]EET88936.1 hypothetical protein CcarbDRAFT_0575 [Clostridium carboxidivorans P7]